MIKNILIGFLILVSAFFIVFANIKANEAEKSAMQAQLNLELAIENEAKAKAQEQKAVEAAAMARIAERKAIDLAKLLEECEK
ncbi:MAG: hypothetical protein ABJF11_02875 [Reichenbachiella sp.]|uniref:hypothetical protein n=1 Tax=Reichenbachiella sp. TaxID=2184521 RepID=UPI0032630323